MAGSGPYWQVSPERRLLEAAKLPCSKNTWTPTRTDAGWVLAVCLRASKRVQGHSVTGLSGMVTVPAWKSDYGRFH
ncbi:MAG: hypothetical protein AB8B36_10135 [Prochlorococcus sp.]